MPKDAPPNGDAASESVPMGPTRRVSEMQAKLHRPPRRPIRAAGSTTCSTWCTTRRR